MKKDIIVLFIVLCVVGCRKVDLYHGLTEEEANDMLVVLHQEGIAATKLKEVKQQETVWTVQVDPSKISEAQRILVDHNLPRKKSPGLSEVYKEKGLIPTPDEQKARYLLALKGDIINSLMKIPDVVDADVVLNIPSPDEFPGPNAKEKRPTASVIVKVRPPDVGQEAISEAKIQQHVANTVDNLNPRDVSVIITYITPPKHGLLPGQSLILPSATENQRQNLEEKPVTRIAGLEVVGESNGKLKIYLAIFFLILAILAIVLVFTVIKASRMRHELQDYKGGDAKLIEGKIVDDRPRLGDGR